MDCSSNILFSVKQLSGFSLFSNGMLYHIFITIFSIKFKNNIGTATKKDQNSEGGTYRQQYHFK